MNPNGQPQDQTLQASREPRHFKPRCASVIVEEGFAFDVNLLLNLREGRDGRPWSLGEVSRKRLRRRDLEGDSEGSEGEGQFVAEEELDTTEMTVVFGLEANLKRRVLEQNTFRCIGEAVEPFGDIGAVSEGGQR